MLSLEDVTNLYEARLLAVLAHAYAVKARGYGLLKAELSDIMALQAVGVKNFTAEQRVRLDGWYKHTQFVFRQVGAQPVVTQAAQNPVSESAYGFEKLPDDALTGGGWKDFEGS